MSAGQKVKIHLGTIQPMNINLTEIYFISNRCLIPLGVPCLKMHAVHIGQLCFTDTLVFQVSNSININ